jgi:sirohydrochlorin cobaltochelatase
MFGGIKTLDPLEARLRAILPEEYQDTYEEVQPVSMGSAGLRFGADGKVAWNEMWAGFCDLAMAGGPPHKGMLLQPGSRAAIDAQPAQHAAVVDEICRGVRMVCGLDVQPSPNVGWVRAECDDEAMANWLLRAIVMENVSAQAEGCALDLPAAPSYRMEKEIKNVVTVSAKTCHYWMGHIWPDQQRAIGRLFGTMARESPLVVPLDSEVAGVVDRQQAIAERMSETIHRETGLARSDHRYTGWLGVDCRTVRAAVWMMRIIVVCNVLSRREGTVVFVPVNSEQDPDGALVAGAVARVHRLAAAKGVVTS